MCTTCVQWIADSMILMVSMYTYEVIAEVWYAADMELWLKSSVLTNFVDDTTTDTKGKDLAIIKSNLEADANEVLKYMASNGLFANQSKTEFMVL